MTPEERKEMLCALAERVMGWQRLYVPIEVLPDRESFALNNYGEIARWDATGKMHMWNPLESTADAWMLVDELMNRGFNLRIDCDPSVLEHFEVSVYLADGYAFVGEVTARTASLAICRAALATLEPRQ